jgi:hypothetical protein
MIDNFDETKHLSTKNYRYYYGGVQNGRLK